VWETESVRYRPQWSGAGSMRRPWEMLVGDRVSQLRNWAYVGANTAMEDEMEVETSLIPEGYPQRSIS